MQFPTTDPCPAGSSLPRHAVRLSLLRRARVLECLWDVYTCAAAAEGGHLAVLVWAREHGCPWREDLEDPNLDCCALATRGGHLDVLMWLREQECPWDAWTCAAAAEGGHLDVLRWAWKQGCPWSEDLEEPDSDCCALAANGGHLEVLTWLRGHHCPWTHGRALQPQRADP
jgi:hypothetical protein